MSVFLGFVFSIKEMGNQTVVDGDPLYAQPNKKPKAQAENGMHSSGSKGKTATGRVKKSRKYLKC